MTHQPLHSGMAGLKDAEAAALDEEVDKDNPDKTQSFPMPLLNADSVSFSRSASSFKHGPTKP